MTARHVKFEDVEKALGILGIHDMTKVCSVRIGPRFIKVKGSETQSPFRIETELISIDQDPSALNSLSRSEIQ